MYDGKLEYINLKKEVVIDKDGNKIIVERVWNENEEIIEEKDDVNLNNVNFNCGVLFEKEVKKIVENKDRNLDIMLNCYLNFNFESY